MQNIDNLLSAEQLKFSTGHSPPVALKPYPNSERIDPDSPPSVLSEASACLREFP